jgi:hypothetical protein
MHSKPSPLGGERKDQKMKSETEILLERFGRYCMWHLPSLEEYVSEAQETKDVKPLLDKMKEWSFIDRIRDIADKIRELEGKEGKR